MKFKSVSMSLVLNDVTTQAFESVLSQCEKHLGKPPSEFLYRRDDETTTAYVKTQKIQGRNPFKVLQRQGGDPPHDVRGKALRGEGGTRDRWHDRRRKDGEPSGESSRG